MQCTGAPASGRAPRETGLGAGGPSPGGGDDFGMGLRARAGMMLGCSGSAGMLGTWGLGMRAARGCRAEWAFTKSGISDGGGDYWLLARRHCAAAGRGWQRARRILLTDSPKMQKCRLVDQSLSTTCKNP